MHETSAARIGAAVLSAQVAVPMVLGPGVRCGGWMTVTDRRALVLGGGGVTGMAWETGLIAGLAGLGIDLAAAGVIIGTSAGSVAGTDIASGQELEALYQAQPAPPAPGARRPDRLGLHRQAAAGRAYQPGPEAGPGPDRQAGAGRAHHARTLAAGHHRRTPFFGRRHAHRRHRRPGAPIRAGGHRRAGGRGHRRHGQPAPAGGRADRSRSRVALARPDRAAVRAIGRNAAAAAKPIAAAGKIHAALLATADHDLRTPLAAAKAAVDALRASDATWKPEQVRELAASADASLDQLTRLVDNLLDLSRLQAGKLPLRPGQPKSRTSSLTRWRASGRQPRRSA